MACLLCVRILLTQSAAPLTRSHKLRKAVRPTITQRLPVFSSRIFDFIPLRYLRPYRLIQTHNPRLYSSTSNTNLTRISSRPRANISVPHPPLPPLTWPRHTSLQRHGQNIPRLTHMHGDHRRRSQRSLRRPARPLRLQASPRKRYLRQNRAKNGHRPQTISKENRSPGPNLQPSRHTLTRNPPQKKQDRAPPIRPSRRALPPFQNPPSQPPSRHRAPHAASPSGRPQRPRVLLLALTRQAARLQKEQGRADPIRSCRQSRQGGADGWGGSG